MSEKPDGKHKKMEKYILRKAFDVAEKPYLPEEVLWRQKEQFSDGVGYSWVDGLRDYAESVGAATLLPKRVCQGRTPADLCFVTSQAAERLWDAFSRQCLCHLQELDRMTTSGRSCASDLLQGTRDAAADMWLGLAASD